MPLASLHAADGASPRGPNGKAHPGAVLTAHKKAMVGKVEWYQVTWEGVAKGKVTIQP